MNFPKKHSHKWAATFDRAKRYAGAANALYREGDIAGAKKELDALVNGDFSDENAVFPGLKIAGAYWRAVEGEMNLRFEVLHEFCEWPESVREAQYVSEVERYYRLFLDDVKQLLAEGGALAYDEFAPYAKDFDTVKLGDGWVPMYQSLCVRTDKALEKGFIEEALLGDWLVFCLRGVVAYDYGLIRQGVLSRLIIERRGFGHLKKIVDASAVEFGWRVTRLFFADMYPKAGIDGMVLRQLGRYGMFADQDLVTTEKKPAAGKEDSEPAYRFTEFFNCEERGIFELISSDSKIPLSQLGLGVCVYCLEHARKTAALFTPPDRSVQTAMVRALGLGAESCLFETELKPADDMERFMRAQDIVFYYDGDQ